MVGTQLEFDQSLIFGPFFGMMLLTVIVWVYMYSTRLPFIFGNKLKDAQLRPHEFARLSPPHVANPSDNLKNLFEIPALFYALCLYLYSSHLVDGWYVYAGWGFLLFRVGHSVVHCTFNFIPLRFALYLFSSFCFFFILGRASFNHFL
mmetsp:Transcript_23829/g.32517  ORF Transcript_23829/g.32517 Transcript_23829/m.32517 type:complete len:148 (-) Transcript_23829:123-566(-)